VNWSPTPSAVPAPRHQACFSAFVAADEAFSVTPDVIRQGSNSTSAVWTERAFVRLATPIKEKLHDASLPPVIAPGSARPLGAATGATRGHSPMSHTAGQCDTRLL